MNLAQILSIYIRSKLKRLAGKPYRKNRQHPTVKEFWQHVVNIECDVMNLKYESDNPLGFASAFSSLTNNLQDLNAFMLSHSGEVLERWTGEDNLVLALESHIRADPAGDHEWQIAHIATYNPLAAWRLVRLVKEVRQ